MNSQNVFILASPEGGVLSLSLFDTLERHLLGWHLYQKRYANNN